MMLLVGSKSIHPAPGKMGLHPCVTWLPHPLKPGFVGHKDITAHKARRDVAIGPRPSSGPRNPGNCACLMPQRLLRFLNLLYPGSPGLAPPRLWRNPLDRTKDRTSRPKPAPLELPRPERHGSMGQPRWLRSASTPGAPLGYTGGLPARLPLGFARLYRLRGPRRRDLEEYRIRLRWGAVSEQAQTSGSGAAAATRLRRPASSSRSLDRRRCPRGDDRRDVVDYDRSFRDRTRGAARSCKASHKRRQLARRIVDRLFTREPGDQRTHRHHEARQPPTSTKHFQVGVN